MTDGCTIGELARRAGVAASTVRFYERRGLLEAAGRSRANYRIYGPRAEERLGFIRSAQQAGFTLKDIEVLLGFRDDRTPSCGGVQALIVSRLELVEAESRRLVQVERMLRGWLSVCREAEASGRCGVLEGLREKNLEKTGNRP